MSAPLAWLAVGTTLTVLVAALLSAGETGLLRLGRTALADLVGDTPSGKRIDRLSVDPHAAAAAAAAVRIACESFATVGLTLIVAGLGASWWQALLVTAVPRLKRNEPMQWSDLFDLFGWVGIAADSSARSAVVPAATMRPPAARVAAMAATASAPTSYHSLCMRCASMLSARTGWKVPAPTCSVTRVERTPCASSAASTASSKCSDAVGAATAPGRLANTVW